MIYFTVIFVLKTYFSVHPPGVSKFTIMNYSQVLIKNKNIKYIGRGQAFELTRKRIKLGFLAPELIGPCHD